MNIRQPAATPASASPNGTRSRRSCGYSRFRDARPLSRWRRGLCDDRPHRGRSSWPDETPLLPLRLLGLCTGSVLASGLARLVGRHHGARKIHKGAAGHGRSHEFGDLTRFPSSPGAGDGQIRRACLARVMAPHRPGNFSRRSPASCVHAPGGMLRGSAGAEGRRRARRPSASSPDAPSRSRNVVDFWRSRSSRGLLDQPRRRGPARADRSDLSFLRLSALGAVLTRERGQTFVVSSGWAVVALTGIFRRARLRGYER